MCRSSRAAGGRQTRTKVGLRPAPLPLATGATTLMLLLMLLLLLLLLMLLLLMLLLLLMMMMMMMTVTTMTIASPARLSADVSFGARRQRLHASRRVQVRQLRHRSPRRGGLGRSAATCFHREQRQFREPVDRQPQPAAAAVHAAAAHGVGLRHATRRRVQRLHLQQPQQGAHPRLQRARVGGRRGRAVHRRRQRRIYFRARFRQRQVRAVNYCHLSVMSFSAAWRAAPR